MPVYELSMEWPSFFKPYIHIVQYIFRKMTKREFLYLQWTNNTTHTHTQGLWSGTTRVGRYQKKNSPTHTHPDYWTSFINFLHLQWSIASSLFSLHAWQSSLTTSLQVLFGLPLGLGPSTSYSMHFFTQSSPSLRSTCPYNKPLIQLVLIYIYSCSGLI